MRKASNLRWSDSYLNSTSTILYGETDAMYSYPFGSVSQVGKHGTFHAFVRLELFEPQRFMSEFTTQQEAMDFVQLMVRSIDYD